LCDADASSPPTWCTCHRLQFSVLFDASRAVDSAVLFVMLGAVRCDMCFHRCWSALLVRPSLVRRCAQCMAGAVCCGSGTIIANLHCPVQQNLLVCIVDFPSYKGPSLIGKNWPSTWVPVAQVTKICEHGCCERTGFPLTPGNHVTLFKCQGITCGKGRQKEKMLLHCEDLHEGEKRWPRSFYVALTRTVNASDLAFINIVGLKKDLWESINNARYHKSAKEQRTQDTQLSQKTLQRMKKYTTDAGWVEFLLLVDELANDGIHDGRCNANDKAQCARMGCAACKLETSKKDRPTR